MEDHPRRREFPRAVILKVQTASAIPPYEQIRAQIATMVMSGVLAEGARLPSIRQLATDLGIAVNTVGRAYQELEREGVIETRGRHGTFVRSRPAKRPEVDKKLAEAARHFALQARQLGAEPARALKSIKTALASDVSR